MSICAYDSFFDGKSHLLLELLFLPEHVTGSAGRRKGQVWGQGTPRKTEVGMTAAFRPMKGPCAEKTDQGPPVASPGSGNG